MKRVFNMKFQILVVLAQTFRMRPFCQSLSVIWWNTRRSKISLIIMEKTTCITIMISKLFKSRELLFRIRLKSSMKKITSLSMVLKKTKVFNLRIFRSLKGKVSNHSIILGKSHSLALNLLTTLQDR